MGKQKLKTNSVLIELDIEAAGARHKVRGSVHYVRGSVIILG